MLSYLLPIFIYCEKEIYKSNGNGNKKGVDEKQ